MDQRLVEALKGRYTIERELGGGGMSRVFIAQENELDRKVVIKVIAEELVGEVSSERFAREVKLAARLQQANIVPLLSAGDADGRPYYTMPFVRGESLRARIARGDKVPLLEAIGILRDLARALSYAHGEGVIHRDIKPENILISGGTAVVTDFGIAKALSASRTMDGTTAFSSGLTQLGSSIGTPAYMAPEQAAGDTDADHRIDIYAWGMIAWELIAGRHPFATRTTPQALLAAQMAERPDSLANVNTQVPPILSSLVERCLDKDPARRPQSATELIAGLDSIATPSGTADSIVRNAPRSYRRVAVPVAAMVLIIIVAAGTYIRGAGKMDASSVAPSIVVIPFENLGAAGDEDFADGVTEEIAGRLARIPGLQVVARVSVKKFRESTAPPHEIARQLGAAYALSGTIRWARASGASNDASVRIVPSLVLARTGTQVWGEPLQETLADVFKAQAAIAERVADALSVTLDVGERAQIRRRESENLEAREAVLLGFRLLERRGAVNLRQALVQFDRAIEKDSLYARAWAGRAESHGLLVSYFDTTVNRDTAFARSQHDARRAVALDSLLSEAQVALASAMRARPREALRAADRAIELDPGSAAAFTRRGTMLMTLGRVAEAEAAFRRAVKLEPLVAAYALRLGWWYLAAGKVDSAIAAMNHAVELDPSNTVINYFGSAIYAHAGRLEDAIKACNSLSGNPGRCRDLWTGLVDPRQGRRALELLHGRGRNGGEPILTDPSFRALAYARLSARDSAFAALRETVRDNVANQMAFINAPWMKPLQSDSRWDQIIGEMRRR